MTEKIKVHAKQPSRDLKYLFQEHKIPVWERSNYPCVYIENRLVAVLNIGIDDEARAKKNEEGYVFTYKKPQF
jgi:tRNA(Ile)-lysidine synthase